MSRGKPCPQNILCRKTKIEAATAGTPLSQKRKVCAFLQRTGTLRWARGREGCSEDGDRERIQAFEGTVIAKKHGGVAETFTVRRVAYGVGIERVFPINSPFVEKVTVVRKGKVRRAKLFYLRGRTGKAAKVKSDI